MKANQNELKEAYKKGGLLMFYHLRRLLKMGKKRAFYKKCNAIGVSWALVKKGFEELYNEAYN